jgi:hypothetical protein
VTKDGRNLNFHRFLTQKLYQTFTVSLPKLNLSLSGLVKPVVFRSFSVLADGQTLKLNNKVTKGAKREK